MQIRISTKDGIPLYKQIINQIKYLIASNRLSPGEKLPPVRKLALGLLKTRQGSGVTVSESGSPLAKDQQIKILTERIDILLAEAQQMNVSLEQIIELLNRQSSQLNS